MDNLIGKTLDGLYTVRELIGTGGMANVYKAVVGPGGPVPEGTVVAVKVLRQEYMHDPDLVRRFKNESKAISLLNHPNIVKVYDVSVNDDLQYIVMEYVDGMTLREYLNERGGKLTSRETVHFISQILKALEHAHANGVVHRDIKPQNIMLLDNGQLRMMDFGIARISRAENQLLSGKAMGSVHYISPEQAKGDETDFTSDLYSVGVMMYEMLSGHLPFDADDVVEVAIKQISDQPKSLHEIAPQVPAALVEITEKAMAKLPQNRYASAREMLDALDTYVHNPSVMFEYKYITEDAPEKVVKRTMNQNRAIRQNEQPTPRKNGKSRSGKKRRTVFLPALFGITIAFALACMALCWMILNDSSNLMNNKADITLGDYIGMTQDEAAKPQLLDFLAGEPEAENDPFADQPTKTAPELPELTPAQELAGYIRARSAAALLTPHALLLTEVENADELLAQMPADPQCTDIVTRAGAKDTYYYSNANMSDNYAMIAQLIEDKDLCVMFAEMVRFNARIYPSATPLKYFQRSPYGLAPEEIEQTWKTMQGRLEFADIEELTNNQNERFLFSTKHLTRRYAKAISDVDDFCD